MFCRGAFKGNETISYYFGWWFCTKPQKTYWILFEYILAKHLYHTMANSQTPFGGGFGTMLKISPHKSWQTLRQLKVKQQRRDTLPFFLLLFWAASLLPLPLMVICRSGSSRSLSWESGGKLTVKESDKQLLDNLKSPNIIWPKHNFSKPQALYLLDMHATSWHRREREQNTSTMSQHCFVSVTLTCTQTLSPPPLNTVA